MTTATTTITRYQALGASSWQDGLRDYAGEYVDDFDWDAIFADYAAAVNAALPAGLTFLASGEVTGPADFNGDVDLAGIMAGIDIEPILRAHDITQSSHGIDYYAFYVGATIHHSGRASANVDSGSGWIARCGEYLATTEVDWITDSDPIGFAHLEAWMHDDMQDGVFAPIPHEPPATRQEADTLVSCIATDPRMLTPLERTLARFWGDRDTRDFDDIYSTDTKA